jgi:hypothetical protein
MPIQFLASRFLIGVNVLLLRYHATIPIMGIITFGGSAQSMNLIVVTFMMTFAQTQRTSKKCIRTWRTPKLLFCFSKRRLQQDFKYFQKFKKSCKPIALQFGNFCIVSPKSVLEYFISIARGTMRLLLTT